MLNTFTRETSFEFDCELFNTPALDCRQPDSRARLGQHLHALADGGCSSRFEQNRYGEQAFESGAEPSRIGKDK